MLDSNSSDSEDNVVLSAILHHKTRHPTDPSPTPPQSTQVSRSPSRVASPSKEVPSRSTDHGTTSVALDSPQASIPIDKEDASDDTDEDYVSVNEDNLVLEETTTSTEDHVSSPNNQTSEP